MLFNIIAIILCIYTVLSPLLMLRCIKFGFGMKENPQKELNKPIIPKTEKKKKVKLTKEQQSEADFLQNIMNYTGDELGQKKI